MRGAGVGIEPREDRIADGVRGQLRIGVRERLSHVEVQTLHARSIGNPADAAQHIAARPVQRWRGDVQPRTPRRSLNRWR